MLASLVSKAPVVRLTLEHSDILLHPTPVPGQPTVDPIVRGAVLIDLSTPRAVKKVRVVLEGLCDVFGGPGYGYESTTTLHKELEIDLRGEVLQKGSHALNFSFIIPSSTPTYQRCEWGRCRHYVKATVDFSGTFQPSISSPPVAFFLCANPYQPGDELLTQLTMQHDSDDLGPIGMMVSSPHLTVAALVNVRLAFPAPPQGATITSIQGVVSQAFTIYYTKSTAVAAPPPQRHYLVKVSDKKARELTPPGSPRSRHQHHYHPTPQEQTRPSRSVSPRRGTDGCYKSPNLNRPAGASPSPSRERSLSPRGTRIWTSTGAYPYPGGKGGEADKAEENGVHKLVQGEEYIYSRVMRVLDDNFVRPTTLDGSEARIKVSHTIGVELKYYTEADPTEKVMTLAQVATIASCCCLSESLVLPTYDEAGATAGKRVPTYTGHPVFRCTCFNSVDDLYDRDGEQLQQAGRIEVDPNAEALVLGVDRQNKTPSVSEIERWRMGQAVEQGASGKVVPVEEE